MSKIITIQRALQVFVGSLLLVIGASANAKQITNFNNDWQFTLEKQQAAHQYAYDDNHWQTVQLPHDWAVALPYTENGAASTGFKEGGIGWYRKSFSLSGGDANKTIWLEFDGIYNNSAIWVNGHYVGGRPYGYTSFQVDLTPYVNFGEGENVVAVKVDRTAYADSRWYTGSGIYRNVRLVKAESIHIPQWGIQVTTPTVTAQEATVEVSTQIVAKKYQGKKAKLNVAIVNDSGRTVAKASRTVVLKSDSNEKQTFSINRPALWSLTQPWLYQAIASIEFDDEQISSDSATFGIRHFNFDSKKGFFLNGENIKIKGVNIHHDAGAVGTAVPKSVWRSRLLKLKSIGVNALRLSHNPHAPEVLDLADELGLLVNAEAFDDWDRAKLKSDVYLGDNKAEEKAAVSYNIHFNQWAEQDLKDLIRRDFNHPSIIMWSIGNEVEWTYPYYAKASSYDAEGLSYYKDAANFDPAPIRKRLKELNPEKEDNLPIIAQTLSNFVKEVDTTRPVTAGLVHPSVGFASGYTDALDAVGFNYRAPSYEAAHKAHPDAIIYGSENWGAWREWRDVKDKDYVAGIFVWTGFAYKGEAGPLPRMGLEISLFDFVGNKTARGHFFETLWLEQPKTYLVTTALKDSEFSFDKNDLKQQAGELGQGTLGKGWRFKKREAMPGMWAELRRWEWYDGNETWNYTANEPVVVQSYSNAQVLELFLNGESLGKQQRSDFEDNIVKWLVPFAQGELKVVGYDNGKQVSSDVLSTHGALAKIALRAEKQWLMADGVDTTYVHTLLTDEHGVPLAESSANVRYEVEGEGELVIVDNGWEKNVQDVLADNVDSYRGRSAALIKSTNKAGKITVRALVGKSIVSEVELQSRH